MEPAVPHIRVEPVPAVRREQPRELLVFEERLDGRMRELLELPRPRRRDHEPGHPQCLQQVGRRIGIEAGRLERGAQSRENGVEQRRALPVLRSWPEVRGEHVVVGGGTPREPGEPDLRRDERAGGFRREQQAEACRVGRSRDRLALQRELRQGVLGGRDLRFDEVEERMLLSSLGSLRRGLVPRGPVGSSEHRRRGERRIAQDRVREAKVDAALDAHTRREKRGIPATRVVPHPPRALGLEGGDRTGKRLGRHEPRLTERPPVVLHRLEHGAVRRGEQGDVHAPSLPPATDTRFRSRRRTWPTSPSAGRPSVTSRHSASLRELRVMVEIQECGRGCPSSTAFQEGSRQNS
jgi:hypothetical protein